MVPELQIRLTEWPDILPLLQSALNNAPFPSRCNVRPITAFIGMESTPPISTFFKSETMKAVTVSELQLEKALNIKALQDRRAELHLAVKSSLQAARACSRQATGKRRLPNFTEGDYVLVARSDFHAGKKLDLRWGGSCRIVKALNEYTFRVEDLGNGQLDDLHGTLLKL